MGLGENALFRERQLTKKTIKEERNYVKNAETERFYID